MDVAHDAETWEKVVRKLRLGTMPPLGARRPDRATYDGADRVARRAGSTPPPRRVPTRAARCCIGSTAPSTPTRSAICSGSTSTSRRSCRPTMRRTDSTTWRTRSAARRRCCRRTSRPRARSARWPSATRASAPGSDTYSVRQDLSQDQHLDGLPLGTFGGMTRAALCSRSTANMTFRCGCTGRT